VPPTLPQAVWRNHEVLVPLLPVKQWYSLRQHGSFAIHLFFLIDEIQSSQRNGSLGLVMLSQQPVASFKIEVY
jgi:hypothetical protein